MKQKKKLLLVIPLFFLLTGCWDSLSLKHSAMVMGTGIDKMGKDYVVSVEILKPGGGGSSGSNSVTKANSIVLESQGETVFSTIRDFIRSVKRRLYFTHNRVWIIGEKLARDNIVRPFDLMNRDQMFRLDSYIFVTKEHPSEILNTPVLFSGLMSLELSSSMSTARFVSDYPVMQLKDFFMDLASSTQAASIPLIRNVKEVDKKVTEIEGTAIIKGEKMVGTLNSNETMGMLWLLNKVKSGSITVATSPSKRDNKVSLEIVDSKTQVTPSLKDDKARFKVQIKLYGTLAELPPNQAVTEQWIHKISGKLSDQVKRQINTTLQKLQKKYKTDTVNFGQKVYRKYPKDWHRLNKKWSQLFSDAPVQIDVEVNIIHQGLVNETHGHNYHKPQNNPFSFFKMKG